MKKYILGGIIAILINYCIGSTYIIYKDLERRNRKCGN